MPRWERAMLHYELGLWIAGKNDDLEAEASSTAPPRTIRREGLF